MNALNPGFSLCASPRRNSTTLLVDLLSPSWKWKLRHLSQARWREAAKLRSRINNYSIPVIFVETTDVDEIREAFLRINSGGLRINKADRAFSKASRLDLRRLVKEVRATIAGFDSLDPRTIQAAMALIMGQKETSSKAVESVIARLEREEIEDGRLAVYRPEHQHLHRQAVYHLRRTCSPTTRQPSAD